MSLTYTFLSSLLLLALASSLNEMIGGVGVSRAGNMLRKEGKLAAVISDLLGDKTMYNILMDEHFKTLVGDYSFLKVKHKMNIKVDKPLGLFGSSNDAKCYLTYERPFFDSVITHSGFHGWETSVSHFEVTEKNMYQLAIIVLIDLLVFNYDRTTFRYGITGHQHEENLMLHPHDRNHFSFLPIDNSWGLIMLMSKGKERDSHIDKYHETIRYALNDMQRFAKEYMDYSAKTFFKGYQFTPVTLLFNTARNFMKGWENLNTRKKDKNIPMIKEFVEAFRFVWNDEIGQMVVEHIKKEAMRLEEYLGDIQSRYDELKCGKISEADVLLVKEIKEKILENVKIFEEQNKNQWVPMKQNAMDDYQDIYEEDLYQEYEDLNQLMARLSFLEGYVSGYRKGEREKERI